MLREFIYLNDDLVEKFLAQIEGSSFDHVREKVSNGSSDNTLENERILLQTAESKFNRFFRLAEEGSEIKSVEALETSSDMDKLVKRGSVIEFHDVGLRTSGLHNLSSSIGDFLSLIEVLGDNSVDENTKNSMKAFSNVFGEEKPITLLARIPGDAEVGVILSIEKKFLRGVIEGEATVLLKVTKALRKGESYTTNELTAGIEGLMSESQKEELMENLKQTEAEKLGLSSLELEYPGFIATPIAIYR